MKKLITLDEHNKNVLSVIATNDKKNGIKCPDCGNEMSDTDTVLLSNPPQTIIKCYNCGLKSNRY